MPFEHAKRDNCAVQFIVGLALFGLSLVGWWLSGLADQLQKDFLLNLVDPDSWQWHAGDVLNDFSLIVTLLRIFPFFLFPAIGTVLIYGALRPVKYPPRRKIIFAMVMVGVAVPYFYLIAKIAPFGDKDAERDAAMEAQIKAGLDESGVTNLTEQQESEVRQVAHEANRP